MPLPEGGKKWVEFDPTGLERAAKAVKELDNSGEISHRRVRPFLGFTQTSRLGY